jgi:hypothetical protein
MMSDKDQKTREKLLAYLKKEKIKPDQAGEILKAFNDEQQKEAERQAFEEWQRGVRLRNTMAFFLLAALFLAVTYQGTL